MDEGEKEEKGLTKINMKIKREKIRLGDGLRKKKSNGEDDV